MKHAFLIIAHKDDLVFRTLISMIDNSKNDIFIHMDSKNINYDIRSINGLVQKSKIYHTKHTAVTWGGYSQINAELLLLQLATDCGVYQYYHLISGSDLLIQTQDAFHDFFEKNAGKEFVRFERQKFEYGYRIELYHLLQEKKGRGQDSGVIIRGANYILLEIQKLLHIKNRYSKRIAFQKGTNWFSITDDLARFVLKKRSWIE